MNATSPFDGMMIGYVLAIGLGIFLMMQFAPPFGAKHTLGGAVSRYAEVPTDELEDAVEDEGKVLYYSWVGLAVVVATGIVLRILMYYSIVLKRSLESAGMSHGLAFTLALFPAIVMPFIFKYSSRWLMVRRLDRRFARG